MCRCQRITRQLPREPQALILGATAWYLRFHPAIPFPGSAGAQQHPLLLGLAATVIAICGLALLIRGLFPPTYTLTLSPNTWERLQESRRKLSREWRPLYQAPLRKTAHEHRAIRRAELQRRRQLRLASSSLSRLRRKTDRAIRGGQLPSTEAHPPLHRFPP